MRGRELTVGTGRLKAMYLSTFLWFGLLVDMVVIKPREIATSRSGHANKLSMPVRLCPRYMVLFDVR